MEDALGVPMADKFLSLHIDLSVALHYSIKSNKLNNLLTLYERD